MQLKGNLFLLLAAFIWGTAFVAQLVGMDDLGPFTYCSGRYILGFFAVVIVWFAMRGAREKKKAAGEYFTGWKYGICAGLIMFGGTTTQQISMLYTTAGKAAFLTCLYIIFVPLFSVLLKKKIRKENWIGAFLGMAGLYFLCVKDDLSWNIGDMYAFIGAIFWSFHILFIDRYADRADNIEISIGQISVCAVLSTILAFTFEEVHFSSMLNAWFPIFYAGVMSSGVAFTLQIVGQRYAEPSHAALIMSLESVFGALSGWLILGEQMTGLEIFGCCLMMSGMLITQYSIIFNNK